MDRGIAYLSSRQDEFLSCLCWDVSPLNLAALRRRLFFRPKRGGMRWSGSPAEHGLVIAARLHAPITRFASKKRARL